jgi:hypothetical protein
MFDSIKSLYNEKLIKGRLEFDENLEMKNVGLIVIIKYLVFIIKIVNKCT